MRLRSQADNGNIRKMSMFVESECIWTNHIVTAVSNKSAYRN